MRLARLGSFHQSRLSFMRILLRRWVKDGWQITRPTWKIDQTGRGHAVYCVNTGDRCYSLVAFAHEIDAKDRTDRVIAESWDSSFVLFDGQPSDDDITRLSKNVPHQEAGRISSKELTLSRANRSVRMWDYVLDCLANGQQPDAARLAQTSYLMRTTAVYGSGKFGAADRSRIADRPELSAPFQAEMLTVYLIRQFVLDLMNHCAATKGGARAVTLARDLRTSLGIGNSTGLGMAPFIVNHPALFGAWIMAREEALARLRNLRNCSQAERSQMADALNLACEEAHNWHSEHPYQQAKLEQLRIGLPKIRDQLDCLNLNQNPWDQLYNFAQEQTAIEAQEKLVSVLMEPYSYMIDPLVDCMSLDEDHYRRIDGRMRTNQCRAMIEQNYGFALLDYENVKQVARFWYVSQNKLEPRLGERFEEDGADQEFPLYIARDINAAYQAMDKNELLADFLMRKPEYRHAIRRVQINAKFPYSEIHQNLLHADLMPIDMLRCKLSFFGATKFDPRSDRWVRITLFNNIPYPADLIQESPQIC